MRERNREAFWRPAERAGSRIGWVFFMVALVHMTGCASRERASALLSREQRAANVAACDEIWRTVRARHWDPALGGVDWDGVHDRFRPQVASAVTMDDARCVLRAMLARLGSSHFAIIPAPAEASGRRSAPSGGSDEPIADLAAAGALMGAPSDRGETGMDIRLIDRRVVVVDVVPGSPAERAGIAPGWIIEAVGDKQVSATVDAMARRFPEHAARTRAVVRAVRRALTGPAGATVKVDVLDGAGRRSRCAVALAPPRGRRAQYGHLPPTHVWWERRMLDDGIVYFRFSAFHDPEQVLPAVRETVARHADAAGFVLDLRGNAGGMSAMARGVAGWFVADADSHLGTMQLRQAELKLTVATRLRTYEGPLAILVDEFSASSAEMLAAGLRDLGRARIFGATTAATALPSQVMELANGDLFQFAVGDYRSRGGRRIEGVGVEPDEVIASDRATLLAGGDAVVTAACGWIRATRTAAMADSKS